MRTILKLIVALALVALPAYAQDQGMCLSAKETVLLAQKIKQLKAELEHEKAHNVRVEKCIRDHVADMRPVLSCFTVIKDGQHMEEEEES